MPSSRSLSLTASTYSTSAASSTRETQRSFAPTRFVDANCSGPEDDASVAARFAAARPGPALQALHAWRLSPPHHVFARSRHDLRWAGDRRHDGPERRRQDDAL